MFSHELLIAFTATYLIILFYLAYRGDASPDGATSARSWRYQPLIYTLSLTVYCTSWTFYGAVGTSARAGLEYFSIYLGPILVFVLFYPFLRKLVSVSKQQKTTTIADFIATRYGKSTQVAALVTIIALVGTLPYISLQIKAIAAGYDVLTTGSGSLTTQTAFLDTALGITLILAVFAVLFGARTIDASVHHRGMIHAISFESIVKLLAFLAIAALSLSLILDNTQGPNTPSAVAVLSAAPSEHELGISFLTKTLLAAAAIIVLPRQFHMLAVEARGGELPTARWGFPLYLLLFSLAVLPITAAGIQMAEGRENADLFVLSLPMTVGHEWLAIFAYLGGFSAATGMVIVATLALSTMVSNDLIFPLLVRYGRDLPGEKLHRLLLFVRRLTIVVLILLAYEYYVLAGGGKSLQSIGLLSFAAAIQLLPVIIGGLYWKAGHRHGVIVGLSAGFLIWLFTLLLPSFASERGAGLAVSIVRDGLFALSWLRPESLFGSDFNDALTHGVFWSLLANIAGYIGLSLRARPSFTDRFQASAYVDLHDTPSAPQAHQLQVGDLFELCSRFTGEARARQFFDRGFNFQVQHREAGAG